MVVEHVSQTLLPGRTTCKRRNALHLVGGSVTTPGVSKPDPVPRVTVL